MKKQRKVWINSILLSVFLVIASLYVLAVAPTVTLVTPATTSYTNDDPVVFNCTVTALAPNDTVSSITLYTNMTGTWQANVSNLTAHPDNSTNFTLVGMPEGHVQWNCLGTDNGSITNFSTSNFSLVVDRTAPTITYNNPLAGANISADFQVNATVTDFAVLTVQYFFTNGTNTSGVIDMTKNANFYNVSQPLSLLVDGPYNLTVNATDNATNAATSTRSVTIDTTRPAVVVNSPIVSQNVSNVTLTVNATATDGGSGVQNVTYKYINGSNMSGWTQLTLSATANQYTGSLDTTALADGMYNFTFNATDFAGNSNASVTIVNVRIDTNGPTVTYIQPINNYNTTGATNITINATVTDTYALQPVVYYYENGTYKSTPVTMDVNGNYRSDVFNFSVLVDGMYNLTINATDNLSTSTLATRTFQVDRRYPAYNNSEPPSGADVAGDVTVAVNVVDNSTARNVSFHYSFGTTVGPSTALSPVGGGRFSTTWDVSALDNRLYNITFNTTNTAGLQNVSTLVIGVSVENTEESSSSSSGGGGGGGGGGSAQVSEKSPNFAIGSGESKKLSFTKSKDTGVKELTIKTKAGESVSGARILVAKTTAGASLRNKIDTDTRDVYRYILIAPQTIRNEHIEDMEIRFVVPRSWFDSKGVKENSVVLYHNVGNDWEALPTTKVSTGDEVEYTAVTESLSMFAIAGEAEGATSAFALIDSIREFYDGTSELEAFDIIDLIRAFYA